MRTAREKSNYKFPLFGLVLMRSRCYWDCMPSIADDYFYEGRIFSVARRHFDLQSFQASVCSYVLPVVGVLYIWRDMLGIENVNFLALALPAFLGRRHVMIVHRSSGAAFVWHTNPEETLTKTFKPMTPRAMSLRAVGSGEDMIFICRR